MSGRDWPNLSNALRYMSVDRAYHYTCRAPLYSHRHRHDSLLHIAYIITGKSRIEVDCTTYEIGPSDAIVIEPGKAHASYDDADTDFELIEVHVQTARHFHGLPLPDLRAVTHVHNRNEFIPAMERLVAARLERNDGEGLLARLRLGEVLVLLEKEAVLSKASGPAGETPDRRMLQAHEYIAVNYAKPLTVASLAELALMSPSRFAACFAKAIGKSPMEAVIQTRLRHACELLRHTDFAVGQIASMCGFSSSQYFARLFAGRTGDTPTQFRKRP